MGRYEDRIPSGPALCIGYRVSFPEVKRSGCELITHPYLAPRLSTDTAAPLLPVCVFSSMLRSDCYCKVLHYLHSYAVTLLYYLPAISVILCEVDVDQLIQRIIYTLIPRFSRGLGSKTLREQRNPRITDFSPQDDVLVLCSVFRSFAESMWSELLLFFPQLFNIKRYGAKTCWSCRTALFLLQIERSEWCIFILGAIPKICVAAKYEPAASKRRMYTAMMNNDIKQSMCIQ